MSKHGLRIMRTVSQRSFAQEVPVTRQQLLRQNTKMSIHCHEVFHEVLTIHGQQFPSSPPSSHIITIERRLSCPPYRVALKPRSTRGVNRVNNRVASYIIDIPTLLAIISIMYLEIGKGCSTPDILNHVWSGECHGISTEKNSHPWSFQPLIFHRKNPTKIPDVSAASHEEVRLFGMRRLAAERDANLGPWHRWDSPVSPMGSMVLLYMVCHGSHQDTPFMLAYIPAPWILWDNRKG